MRIVGLDLDRRRGPQAAEDAVRFVQRRLWVTLELRGSAFAGPTRRPVLGHRCACDLVGLPRRQNETANIRTTNSRHRGATKRRQERLGDRDQRHSDGEHDRELQA